MNVFCCQEPTSSNETAADLLAETDALLRDLSQGAPAPPSDGYMSDDEVKLLRMVPPPISGVCQRRAPLPCRPFAWNAQHHDVVHT